MTATRLRTSRIGLVQFVNGVLSEAFPSHEAARKAADRAAGEQRVPGNTIGISYEDKDGHWHDEVADGRDRPVTDVKG